MHSHRLKVLAFSVALACSAGTAHADLARMGPVSTDPTIGGFPTWFQDKTGLTLEFCNLLNQTELNDGWCTLIPPGPVFPENFTANPINFFAEHFYWDATNVLTEPVTGTRARLTVAVEAGFVGGGAAVPGGQMTFGRIRVFIPNLPYTGNYRVIHPFGEATYFRNAGDKLFETDDVGIACPGTFECTLGTAIGPFLLPSNTAGGAEVPPIPDLLPGQDGFYDALVAAGAAKPYPGTGKKYIADPGRIGPVTGSPLANFIDNTGASRNHNTFRVEGPNGFVVDGELNFTLTGRVMTGQIPGNTNVERASFARDATGAVKHVDVFATAAETVQARVPAQPAPATVTPILSFFDAPCGGAIAADGVTINPPPYTAPAAGTATAMANTGADFWGQSVPAALPTHVCVEDATARNAAGQIVPAYYLKPVTDDVTVTAATFSGATNGTLTVSAVSTDALATLSLDKFVDAAGLPYSSVTPFSTSGPTGLLAPPNKVSVSSSSGGAASAPVLPGAGTTALQNTPVAVADSFTMNEDCSPTAALACAGPTNFDPVANDTVSIGGVTTAIRASGQPFTVTITQAPRLGSAVVNVDGSIGYTPNGNANGIDSIIYTVTMGTAVSNPATMAINITPVNDLPVATNKSYGAVVNRANNANLILNDTDPDGNADVKDAVIVTWPPQLGVRPVPVNGVISYTPTGQGTFGIVYQAKDAAGALSANTATTTITVAAAEAITIAKAIYKRGNVGGGASARWTVSGTDGVRQGQTLTVSYGNGTTVAALGSVTCNGTQISGPCVIGTATVDSLGNYLLDFVTTPGGRLDPTDVATWSTKPSTVRVFSSSPVLGGANATGISLK